MVRVMKNRDYKKFAPETAHHVYNRGNGKMDIFRDEADYQNFLKRLSLALGKPQRMPLLGAKGASFAAINIQPVPPGSFSLIAYCLMPNHFHIEIFQHTDLPVSKLISKVSTSYSMYFNRKYSHVGHVFQDQFKSIPVLTDQQLIGLSAYIHQNPVTAGLVKKPDEWKYSSYHEYMAANPEDICNKELVSNQFASIDSYELFVEERGEDIKARREIQELILD